jgi:predicted RNase H-like HicB family nuclease
VVTRPPAVRLNCVQGRLGVWAVIKQAKSLDEVTQRIREAIELCLEVEGVPEQSLEFVGNQRITIAA